MKTQAWSAVFFELRLWLNLSKRASGKQLQRQAGKSSTLRILGVLLYELEIKLSRRWSWWGGGGLKETCGAQSVVLGFVFERDTQREAVVIITPDSNLSCVSWLNFKSVSPYLGQHHQPPATLCTGLPFRRLLYYSDRNHLLNTEAGWRALKATPLFCVSRTSGVRTAWKICFQLIIRLHCVQTCCAPISLCVWLKGFPHRNSCRTASFYFAGLWCCVRVRVCKDLFCSSDALRT